MAQEAGAAPPAPVRRLNRQLAPGARARLKAQAIELVRGTDKTPPLSARAAAAKLGINRKTIATWCAEAGFGLLPNTPHGAKGVYVRPEGPRGNRTPEPPPPAPKAA